MVEKQPPPLVTLEKLKKIIADLRERAQTSQWLLCLSCQDNIDFRCTIKEEDDNVVLYIPCCGRLMHKKCIINYINIYT